MNTGAARRAALVSAILIASRQIGEVVIAKYSCAGVASSRDTGKVVMIWSSSAP
jgi:hypothetical protein